MVFMIKKYVYTKEAGYDGSGTSRSRAREHNIPLVATDAGRALESCVNEVVEWASQQTRKFELALPTTFHDMVKNSLKRQRATETDAWHGSDGSVFNMFLDVEARTGKFGACTCVEGFVGVCWENGTGCLESAAAPWKDGTHGTVRRAGQSSSSPRSTCGRKVNAAGLPSSSTASSTTAANCNDGDPTGWRGTAAAAGATVPAGWDQATIVGRGGAAGAPAGACPGAYAVVHKKGQTPFVERCPSVIPHKRKQEIQG
ncbi:hypothetical protein CYMTET_16420 [Cymbomonas tetramitiformis]|uniref:Uncharacterized protein n=1 Tax=Cymbomonas tetramitiformis TaxID=36881 RepID=A0AAE0GC94_9CHLO|nr:hypothetical protein CYMTET_16420 [Cymbomonas tetramitiformis]